MDELTIEGKLYISSKRAAKVSGYAKDYIGQLCREGRVDSKLVGRSWYVYEPSIREHRFNDERTKAKKGLTEEKAETPKEESEETHESPIDTSWERPSYTPEVAESLPELVTPVKASTEPESLGEMQSAWQEWFAERGTTVETPVREEKVIKAETSSVTPVYSAPKEESVPVRMIVSDIAPVRERQEQLRESYTPQEATVTRQAKPKGKDKRHTGGLIIKSSLIAFIVILASITVVATGLIEELHLGGISNSPFLQYFQGSNVVEK